MKISSSSLTKSLFLGVLLLPMAAYATPSSNASSNTSSGTSSSSPPTTDWSGLYAGLHAGTMWGYFNGASSTALGPNGTDIDVMGGGQIGYNWQIQNFVLGAEGDISAAPLNPSASGGANYDETWMSTLRARAGYAIGSYLPYATVGLGLTGSKTSLQNGSSTTDTHAGYALGAGVDLATGTPLSWRLEYLHVDVPQQTDNFGPTTFNGSSSNNIIRVGLNYHFF